MESCIQSCILTMNLCNYPRHISLPDWSEGGRGYIGNTFKSPSGCKYDCSFKWTALQAQKSHQNPHTSATLWQCNHFVHWILHLFYNISLSPSVRLSFYLGLCPCMHSIFILTLNGISFLEIRYQPGCPLLFQPWSEDSSYDLDTALSSLSSSLLPISLSKPVSLSPSSPFLPSPLLLILNSEASPPLLPHLLLALNQMEHIKSGMRSRQWLLWLPAVFGLVVLHSPIKWGKERPKW